MDYDRKSTVSSFYGGRKSHEALNSDFPSGRPSPQHQSPTRDDASSFFQSGDRRTSMDMLQAGRPSFASAGYNRESFMHAGRQEPLKGGRDEEQGAEGAQDRVWDVYADFNNTGPRYSSAFGQTNEKGYQQIPPSTPPKSAMMSNTTAADEDPVEMVTVPALGAEWGREELRDMTKSARKEKKAEARREKLKAWNRDQRGMCGKHFTRKVFVFFLFAVCAVAAIILGFMLPRVPGITFNTNGALIPARGAWNDSIPTYFNRAPANFSFPAYVSLQVDTTSNYLPLQFNSIDSTVFDLNTLRQVAKSRVGHRSLPARSFPKMLLPLNFTYVATNSSDITWANWYNGCRNSATYPNGQRPPVKFRLVLDMSILGLPSRHRASAEISEAACPIELSQNSA